MLNRYYWELLLLIISLLTYEQKGYPPKIFVLLHIILFYAISDKHQTVTFLKRSEWSDIDNPFYDKNKGRYKAKKTGIYIVYFHVGLEVKSATQITGFSFTRKRTYAFIIIKLCLCLFNITFNNTSSYMVAVSFTNGRLVRSYGTAATFDTVYSRAISTNYRRHLFLFNYHGTIRPRYIE